MKVTIKVEVLDADRSYWDSDRVEKEMEISIDDDQALMKMLGNVQAIGGAVCTMAIAAFVERKRLRDAPPEEETDESES